MKQLFAVYKFSSSDSFRVFKVQDGFLTRDKALEYINGLPQGPFLRYLIQEYFE